MKLKYPQQLNYLSPDMKWVATWVTTWVATNQHGNMGGNKSLSIFSTDSNSQYFTGPSRIYQAKADVTQTTQS